MTQEKKNKKIVPPVVLKEGYLVKRAVRPTLGMHGWRSRYFVLDNNSSLSYYRSNNGPLKGQILLTENTTVQYSSKRSHAFVIHTPYVELFLQANSDESRNEWILEIERVIKNKASKKDGKAWKKVYSAARTAKEAVVTNNGTHLFQASAQSFEVDVRYKFKRVIGQGAYGIVISAEDTKQNRVVAIKKINNVFGNNIDAKRILRELVLLRHLRHPNISRIQDIMRPPPKVSANENGKDEFNDVYIVMDLMDTDLHRVIYSTQQLTDQHVKYLLFQLLHACRYLKQAHVVHRDLKPSNILVNAECSLQVCDFGLSRGLFTDVELSEDDSQEDDIDGDENGLTVYVVTRWYRAPELLLGSNDYTAAIDLWSVGCIFAELLGRKPLFPGKDYINQMQLIFDVLGTPSEEELDAIGDEKAKSFFRKHLTEKEATPFEELPQFSDSNAIALDLLKQFLILDPRKRITADKALKHPYFKEYYSVELLDCKNPIKPRDIEDRELSIKGLRAAIMEEIKKYRPDDYKIQS